MLLFSMSTNEELDRDVAWLETWVEQHPETRAAKRIEAVLTAIKAVTADALPVEEGVPVKDTAEKYKHLADLVQSWIPAGSVWENQHNTEELVANYIWHLYHSHTLGCPECFGGQS